MDDDNLSHLENALKTYPDCVFIGHGPGFWSKMKVADGLMGRYKNLYADISAERMRQSFSDWMHVNVESGSTQIKELYEQ